MILADTGFFIALARPQDELHARALAWLVWCNQPLLVTEYVLLEAMNELSRRMERRKASVLIEEIRAGGGYEFESASSGLLDTGVLLYQKRSDKDWSLTDCISFVVMRDRGMTQALAHDEHFVQAGFDAMLRRDPP